MRGYRTHIGLSLSVGALLAPAAAQTPDHPILTEVYTDANGTNDGPVGRDPTNTHQEYIELYLPTAADLHPSLNKDALRLTFYEVEGDATSSGLGLVNYRLDLPTFDLDGGSSPPVVNRPSSGVVVLGWVDYVGNPPTGLAGMPDTRVALINGGVTTTSGYTFIAMNGAQFTGTTNFPVPTAISLVNMPPEASSGIIQNGSGAYLLVNRDDPGYVELYDDQDPDHVPPIENADPALASGTVLQTTGLLDGFAGNDHDLFDVNMQPYAPGAGIDLETVLPLDGAFSLLIAQVPEVNGTTTFAGIANGYARRYVDVGKTTESGVADDPVADATTAYRHIRNEGPFFPTPGRVVLTDTAAELGLAKAAAHTLQVLAQTTARPSMLAANVGGNFPINLSASAGASSNPSVATFGAGQAANNVPGQTLGFPTVAVTGAAGAAHNATASSTITVTAANSNAGQPPVVAPVQTTTMTATVLNATTGLNAGGQPFQTTVFAAIQGIPTDAGVLNEFRATSLGTYVANNLGGAVQDSKMHGSTLINPATDIGDGTLMQGMHSDGLNYPDPGAFINRPCPCPLPPCPPNPCEPGTLDLLQTVEQSAEVVSGATTYSGNFDAMGVRARRVNIPDTQSFGAPFSPTEPLHFVDATGRAGNTRSGLTNVTTTRTFELAILDTNVRSDNSLETGATDDVGIIIEVAETEPGASVVTGEYVFLSFTGGLQGADIDGTAVPPGNNIANILYLDLDNLHTVLGINTIEAIYLVDAGASGNFDAVEVFVFSFNPATPAACCLPDGSCEDLDPPSCNARSGVFEGSGTTCTTPQACCLPDGTCRLLDPLCCAGLQGTLEGSGAACPTTQACCLPDGTCGDLAPRCCERLGGVPQGAGMNCTTVTCPVPPLVILWNADSLSVDRTTRSLRFRVDAPVTATGSPGQSAIKVTMIDLQDPVPPNLPQYPPPDFSRFECTNLANCAATCTAAGEMNGCARWVGKAGTFLESQDNPGGAANRAARLQCTPFYYDWVTETASGPIAVVGGEIAPSSEYRVRAYTSACKGTEDTCTDVSAAVTMFTRRSGDVEAPFNPPATSDQPNAIDVTQLVNKFKNVAGAPLKAVAQLQPNLPELNADLSALDVVAVVDAVKQFAYAFSGPCACPSAVTCGPAVGSVSCTSPTPCVTAFGAGSLCVKTCNGGDNAGDSCINNTHCPGVGATCGSGFCRDRCGRCTP